MYQHHYIQRRCWTVHRWSFGFLGGQLFFSALVWQQIYCNFYKKHINVLIKARGWRLFPKIFVLCNWLKKTFPTCYPSLVQVQEETLDCGKKLSLLETELLTRCHYLGDEPTNSVLSEFSDPPSCGFSSLGSLSSLATSCLGVSA